MNYYEIINEYNYNYPEILEKVIKKTLKLEKIKKSVFTIIFTDEAAIKKINRNYRKIDKTTDVISFAFEDNGGKKVNGYRLLGEIYICIPKMVNQAKEYSHSEVRELCFLTVHGLLHLLGYNHQNENEEKNMFEKQELILNEFKETRSTKESK